MQQVKKLGEQVLSQTDELKKFPLPIGWSRELGGSWWEWISMVLGLCLTTFAVSLGSAFWFDVLGKALQLRGTGPKVAADTGQVEPTSVPAPALLPVAVPAKA